MASEQQRATALQFQAQPGKAAIYVYRLSGFIGGGIAHPVYVDGRLLGNNGPGTFLLVDVPPGDHILSAGVSQAPFSAASNHVYFFRQTADMTMSGTMHTSSVHPVAADEGKRGISECSQASSNF